MPVVFAPSAIKSASVVAPVPPLLTARVPATSAVAKSTAFVVEPDPMNIDDVSVSDIWESVRPEISVMKIRIILLII